MVKNTKKELGTLNFELSTTVKLSLNELILQSTRHFVAYMYRKFVL